jgi:uncharacterized membrane protein
MEQIIALAVAAVIVFVAGFLVGVLYSERALAEEKTLKDHITAEMSGVRIELRSTAQNLIQNLAKKL